MTDTTEPADTFDLSNPLKPKIPKDPGAILDYSEDWTAWLADIDDTIATFVVTADPSVTVVSHTFSGGIVTAFLGAGASGLSVPVTYTITTAGGRTDSRTFYLKVAPR